MCIHWCSFVYLDTSLHHASGGCGKVCVSACCQLCSQTYANTRFTLLVCFCVPMSDYIGSASLTPWYTPTSTHRHVLVLGTQGMRDMLTHHVHIHVHAHVYPHMHTHTHTHTHTRARTHTHTHTHNAPVYQWHLFVPAIYCMHMYTIVCYACTVHGHTCRWLCCVGRQDWGRQR